MEIVGAPKRKVGRPSGYRSDMPQLLLDFFDRPLYIEIEEEKMAVNGTIKLIKKRIANDLPLFEGFCAKLLISKDTFHRWVKEHKELSDVYHICKEIQKQFIMTHSLNGKYNTGFAKFFAMNSYGMKEISHVEHSGESRPTYSLGFRLDAPPEIEVRPEVDTSDAIETTSKEVE